MFDVRCVLLRNTTGSYNKFYAMVLAVHKNGQSIVVKNSGPIGKPGVTSELYVGAISGHEEFHSVWNQKEGKRGYSLLDEYNFEDEFTRERLSAIRSRIGLSADGIEKLLKFEGMFEGGSPSPALEDSGVTPEPAIENIEIDKTTQYDNWGCW